uniref:Uncharacterized protein n=1 Tax=Aegilops tauschii TaxID=37682 RepID=R7W0J8_AEGTA
MSSGRYMAYSPSPSTTPHSPRISGLRASSAAVADQEKYLAELLAERHKLNPFVPVLPHSIRLLNQGSQGSSSGLIVKKTMRVDIPVDKYPTDESQDFFKKQQLRELAMLNGTLREEGMQRSGSASPFHNSLGMKRAKTRGEYILQQMRPPDPPPPVLVTAVLPPAAPGNRSIVAGPGDRGSAAAGAGSSEGAGRIGG